MASLKIGDSPGKIMFRVKRQLRVKNPVYPQNTAQQIKGEKEKLQTIQSKSWLSKVWFQKTNCHIGNNSGMFVGDACNGPALSLLHQMTATVSSYYIVTM